MLGFKYWSIHVEEKSINAISRAVLVSNIRRAISKIKNFEKL